MKGPYYLQRPDLTHTAADMARLDNPKLGEFLFLKNQQQQQKGAKKK